jgi:hypothetical protein
MSKIGIVLCICLAVYVPLNAAFGILPDGRLDMKAVRKSYMESDFIPVREVLESYAKTHKKDATRDEKVFIHIYLGVIYAADSIQDAKAESHFNALMDIAPNIELVDMFVPPKIQNIFDRVKHDYLRMKEYGRKYDALGNPLPSASDSARPERKAELKPKSGSRAWLWWTLGGVAAVGTGVGVYLLKNSSEHPGTNTVIDGN